MPLPFPSRNLLVTVCFLLVGIIAILGVLVQYRRTTSIVIKRSLDEAGPPDFPWPPDASAVMTIGNRTLVREGESISLKEVGQRLQEVFNKAGYGQGGYYRVPGGFALASQVEQFSDSDGSPLKGNNRWITEIVPPDLFSIEYFRAIRKGISGHYRVIVFVVTPYPFWQSGKEVDWSDARSLALHGANVLPESFSQIPFTQQYTCTALIYEFKQTNSDEPAVFQPNSSLSANTHLEKAGILGALEKLLK